MRDGTFMPWGRAAWLYDTRTLTSELLPESPVGFHWPEGAAVGEDFFVIGGYVRSADDDDRSSNGKSGRRA